MRYLSLAALLLPALVLAAPPPLNREVLVKTTSTAITRVDPNNARAIALQNLGSGDIYRVLGKEPATVGVGWRVEAGGGTLFVQTSLPLQCIAASAQSAGSGTRVMEVQ